MWETGVLFFVFFFRLWHPALKPSHLICLNCRIAWGCKRVTLQPRVKTDHKKNNLYYEWIAIVIPKEKSYKGSKIVSGFARIHVCQMFVPTLTWELVLVTLTFDDPHNSLIALLFAKEIKQSSNMDKNM